MHFLRSMAATPGRKQPHSKHGACQRPTRTVANAATVPGARFVYLAVRPHLWVISSNCTKSEKESGSEPPRDGFPECSDRPSRM